MFLEKPDKEINPLSNLCSKGVDLITRTKRDPFGYVAFVLSSSLWGPRLHDDVQRLWRIVQVKGYCLPETITPIEESLSQIG